MYEYSISDRIRLFIHNSIILFLALVMSTCSRQPADLVKAEQLMETAPDSALHILQNIPPDVLQNPSDKALHGLLMFQALDKNYMTLQPDTLINFSIHYFEQHADKRLLGSAYFLKARMNKYAARFEAAIPLYMQAKDKLDSEKDALILAKINNDLGEISMKQLEYLLARSYFQQAIINYYKAGHPTNAFYATLDVGRTYYRTKEYKTAGFYYRKALPLATDSMRKGAVFLEMGLNYYAARQFDSALNYLRKSIPYPYQGNNLAIRLTTLGDVFLKLNRNDSACYYAQKGLGNTDDIYVQRDSYRILVDAEDAKGDIPKEKLFLPKYLYCADSIHKIKTQTKISVLELLHQTVRETENEKEKHRYFLWIGFAVLCVATGLIFRLLVQIFSERKSSDKKTEQQKIIIHKDLLHKQNKQLLAKIADAKSEQSALRKKASYLEQNKMDREIYSNLLHINDTDLFYREMNVTFNNLVTKLMERYKVKSSKEIMWCCLYLLDIPSHDILLLLDYKVQSFTKMKQRLAKKLLLNNATELNGFLHMLLTEE